MEAFGEQVEDEDPESEMDQDRGVEPGPGAEDRRRLVIRVRSDFFWERGSQEFIVATGGGYSMQAPTRARPLEP